MLRYVQRLCEEVEQRQASAHDDGATLHDIIKSFDAFEVNLATSLLRTLDSPPDVQSGLRVADKHVRGHAAHVSEGLQASSFGAPPFHPVRVAAHPDQPWGLGCGQKLGALSTRLSKRSLSQTLMRDLDELQSSFKERYSRLLEKRLRTGARLVHTWLCSSISHVLCWEQSGKLHCWSRTREVAQGVLSGRRC